MLTLTGRQTRLIEGAPHRLVNLFVLTTYSDHAATPKTVEATYYWAESYFEYDWENSGTLRQFMPYVQQSDPQLTESMPHLPSGASIEGELVKSYRLVLSNVVQDDGTRLMQTLDGVNLEFADLVVAELFLDPAVPGGEDPASLTGDEHIVLGRYQLSQVLDVTEDSITISFDTERIQGLLPAPVVGPDMSPRDLGKRPPVPYGEVDKVPCLAVQVGEKTTLAQPLSTTATQLTVSDATGFPAAGLVYVGGEAIQYAGASANTLLNLTRDPMLTADHKQGELVVFIPLEVVYAVGTGGSVTAVRDIWMRSPETGEVFKLNNTGTFLSSNTTVIAGEDLATVSWSQTTWRALLDEIISNARVTAQPSFEDPTSPPTTVTASQQYDTNNRRVNNGDEGWSSPGKADGNWDETNRVFTYDSTKTDRKLVCGNDSLPTNVVGVRARLQVSFTIDVWAGGVTTVEVRAASKRKTQTADSPLWGTPGIIASVVSGTGAYSFAGAWQTASGSTSDSETDELSDWELEVFFRVDGGGGAGQFQATVTNLSIEYEYISAGQLLDLLNPVEIRAFAGGAGVELFADVDGPISPPTVWELGYDFPDEGWTNVDSVDVAVTDGRRFYNSTAWTERFSLDSDASNWSAVSDGYIALSDEDSPAPSANPSLQFDITNLVAYLTLRGDHANWSGAYVTSGFSYLEFNPPASATTFTSRATLSATENWSAMRFRVFLLLQPVAMYDELFIRFYDGTDYEEFKIVPFVNFQTDAMVLYLNLDLFDPSSDTYYNATSGTPDMSQVSSIEFGLTRNATAGTAYGLNLGGDIELRRYAGGSVAAAKTFSSEDWSARKYLRFKVFIPNDNSGALISHLRLLIGDASGEYVIYQWAVGVDFDLGAESTLLCELGHLAFPQAHLFSFSIGYDLSIVVKLQFTAVYGSDASASSVANTELYFSDVETLDSIPAAGFHAAVTPGSTTDLESVNDRYEVDFLLRGSSGDIEILISEDTPSPITDDPTNYKKLTIALADFESESRTTAVLSSQDFGTPADMSDVQNLQVRIISPNSADVEIELYSLKKTDDVAAYKAASGALLEHPADVVRHILDKRLGITDLEASSWSDAETNLGSNEVSALLEELGGSFYEILGRLGYEQRLQLVTEETASATEYRLLTAQSGHDWPSPVVATITRWRDLLQDRRDAFTIATRAKLKYELDRSASGGGRLLDDYRASLRADVDVNDSNLATVDLTNAEKQYGIRESGMIGLVSTKDTATATDILTHNLRGAKASSGLFRLAGVPASEGYRIERGDIVSVDKPPSLAAAVNCRVIEKVRRFDAGMTFDFVMVQVAIS